LFGIFILVRLLFLKKIKQILSPKHPVMINFFRKKWFDIGAILAVIVIKGILMYVNHMSNVSLALWMGFASLLLHQVEEYHWPGYFPEMLNKVLYKSKIPDRYPLNANSAFIIDVGIEWTTYIVAAFLAESALWLGIAVMVFSFGNFIMHAFYYNIKAKTFYNPGMVTSVIFLLPVSVFFFWSVITGHIAGMWDYVIGIPLGIFFNLVNFVKIIDWLKDRDTSFVFTKQSHTYSKADN